jgi:hypothetical protein
LLWLRRLIPFIGLAAIISGYLFFDSIVTTRRNREVQRYALATAQIWLEAARYRNEPEKFIKQRDSILHEHSLSVEQIRNYLSRHEKRPEAYELFIKMVNQYIDSLSAGDTPPLQQGKSDSSMVSGDSA